MTTPDLTARITEILREAVPVGDVWPFAISTLTERIAAAAQEHYRPVIETVEQLDALPVHSVVRGAGNGWIWESLPSGWWGIGYGADQMQSDCIDLPAVVLWTPGADE